MLNDKRYWKKRKMARARESEICTRDRNPPGGTSDCSGFTQYVFRTSIGVQLGDWTGAQVGQGKQVPDINYAQPGILSSMKIQGTLQFIWGIKE